ncbi:SRPBCC domain-containing protein [Micromonospora sp. C28ISP2-4]|uniref:SRPBCC domain-containing protein n=1 Tax=Micromonospora sp. C28ISP2-4 TaxID=3059523 RepID=UPI002674EF91|nr:SRPBCC domain-containing protein [Micromonospora sp. C28ISP2-4]MDO3687741.1 SRPBCC domain-containing protein [Micromonospora sp. C28ISP2-4]
MLNTSTEREIKVGRGRVWAAWNDPKEVRAWLNLIDGEIPSRPGEALRWQFNRGGRIDLVFTATLREVVPQESCVYDWDVPGNDEPTRVVVTFVQVEEDRTKVQLTHSGFNESLRSRLEFDAYDHHWWHYLERLAAYLEHRPFQFHKTITPPKTGIIPLGVAPETGMVVADVAINSAAEFVGIGPGDEIRAIDGIELKEMEDFHRWLDDAEAGQTATFTLKDRTVELVLRPFTS